MLPFILQMLKSGLPSCFRGRVRTYLTEKSQKYCFFQEWFWPFSAESEELTQGTKFCQETNVFLEMNKKPGSLSPHHIYLCDQFDDGCMIWWQCSRKCRENKHHGGLDYIIYGFTWRKLITFCQIIWNITDQWLHYQYSDHRYGSWKRGHRGLWPF